MPMRGVENEMRQTFGGGGSISLRAGRGRREAVDAGEWQAAGNVGVDHDSVPCRRAGESEHGEEVEGEEMTH